jgi:hypothetical protein
VKKTVNKIYEFITKLVLLLEDELDQLKTGDTKNTISTQKNIAYILNKLVNLISQLNKMSKEKHKIEAGDFSNSDKDILNKFIKKIQKEAKVK